MEDPRTINEVYKQIKLRKGPFFLVFFVIMLLSYGALYIVDFLPEPITEGTDEKIEETLPEVIEEPKEEVSQPDSPMPVSIRFDKLDREIKVSNPSSRAIADLDAALLTGAVRHPDSADLVNEGNIFILGHSSYLPNVFNKSYQAFNDIQTLAWGDTIRVRSLDAEYVYRVERVYEAKASDVVVPNSRGEARLTLATCNSFGAKDDRFIVEATLVSTLALDDA